MTQELKTVKTLKSMTKNQIIDLILCPLVNHIEVERAMGNHFGRIEEMHQILIQYGLDAGVYDKETTTH